MVGEIAGLLTAVAWSFTSIFFTMAAKRAGAVSVNLLRLLFALVFLMIIHTFLFGAPIPSNAGVSRWLWLGLSGFIGLVLGDTLLLFAFMAIGTRLSMLLLSLVPIISTFFAWVILGENLRLIEIFAIVVTVGGIAWVVTERNNSEENARARKLLLGIILGIGSAFGQAFALITAKKGMAGNFPALSATLMRILVAMIIFWSYSVLRGQARATLALIKQKQIFRPILGGTLFGPVIGIWLSLIAIKYANVGIASTLMALPPVLLIPLTHSFFKEKITARSVFGTLLAMTGVAVIFLT
ncbi:MAG: DMT family transporter [Calditrichaeota bacterium]|nr:DMT family transporter [Calditrichota bacterium]